MSEGARLLWAYKERGRLSNRELRERCGETLDVVRHLYGDRRPGLAARFAYQRVCSIPVESWDRDVRRTFRLPALRAA